MRFLLFILIAVLSTGAGADEELASGTVVNAENLNELIDKTFEGHRLGDMLIERVQWQIREHGLTLRLAPTKAHPVDPRYLAATEQYASEVRYDPAANQLTGWKAGLPFPNLDESDPHFVQKLIWNIYLGRLHGDGYVWPRWVYLFIDGKRGIERVQQYSYSRIYMKGRMSERSGPVLEPGNILHRSISWGVSPQDIKDTGTFIVTYDDGSYDDGWLYLRNMRRTRRMSSGSWKDPIGNTDQLSDDFNLWNAHPSWYKSFELLGKQTVLVVANADELAWVDSERNHEAAFPLIDHSAAPYWNPVAGWEPREVYVVKCTPKKDHPYGYKIIYLDAKLPLAYLGRIYDKKSEFWKFAVMAPRVWPGEDGGVVVLSHWGGFFDFKRMHATYFYPNHEARYNVPMTDEDVNLMSFEARGR